LLTTPLFTSICWQTEVFVEHDQEPLLAAIAFVNLSVHLCVCLHVCLSVLLKENWSSCQLS